MLNYKLDEKTAITNLKFTLLDMNFRELFSQEYSAYLNTKISSLSFSSDEKYMGMDDNENNIFLAKFENGMEHDLFFDKQKGQVLID